MRTYVATTTGLFALLTLLHLWRLVVEPHYRTSAFHLGVIAIGAALALWGWRVLRAAPAGH